MSRFLRGSPHVVRPLARAGLCVLAMVLFVCPLQTSTAAEKRPLMRFPDVHDNTIVFVYGEDIWTVPVEGGVATRITGHDGEERFPKFSPDGKTIAFTGEYDGNFDVYVMSVHGGEINRVTYHPGFDAVVGWHPTNGKILFRSRRHSFNRFDRLFLVSPDGTGLEELILHEAAQGSFFEDATKIAYNREAREFRTWKRYKGGNAQDLYVFDFEKNTDTKLTEFEGTDRMPMWIGNKIYFSSDRDRVLNIYAYDTNTKEIVQVTRHTDYDVRRPSQGGDRIVYELGGTLWLLDTTTAKTSEVPVKILTDAEETRPYMRDVDGYITGFHCSPSGKRALIVARGEVFTVPQKEGPTRNLTKDPGARDKDAVWSPDGKTIAYLSDKNGEYEIHLVDPKGASEAVRLTRHKNGYRHTLRWSPDSKKIAFADQTLRCYYVDVDSKKVVEVDKAEYENVDVSLDLKPIYDFAWSPDSRYIAYSKMDADQVYKIYVYSIDTGDIHCVSNGLFNDFGPVFSRDGEHLFFISNRRFDPTFCDFEWELVYKRVAGIYCVTLRADGESVLPFESDEEKIEEDGDSKNEDEKNEKEGPKNIRIDFDGIADRIEALPLPRGNYRRLAAGEKALFYLNKNEGDFNRFEFRSIGPMDLYRFSFEDREEKSVISGIGGYELSADGKKIVYRQEDSIGIIDSSAEDSAGEPLDLSGLRMRLDPLAEWRQIYNEAWRLERDFYYEPEMHGLDWDAMKKKYGRLLPHVSCRQDMRYLVGELIGELNTSHTYVYGGDRRRRADRVNVGMLGVDWEVDAKNNRYRFKKIYRVPDWTREIIPPLSKPGVGVREGDYLLRVNGQEVTADRNIYSFFQDLAGEQVTLLVNDKPTDREAKEYTVEPLRGERTLRYLDWVEHNRMVAEKASDGQIGYIHLPDTYLGAAREFPKYFYAQSRKKGLIVDGRFNGGGLDPDIFLQRLDKKLLSYWTRRYSHDQTDPAIVTTAHLVCLTNRQAGSGGDMLPLEFQTKGMGPVIGTRTWGGLVGVSMFIGMIDGGGLTAPDYRIYDRQGNWVVENVGVHPDIIVDLDPVEMSQGHDAQLMKGIEVLTEKIKIDPRPWPKHESLKTDG
ncbi:MAG: PD40 domain-containing protein [Candidatus Latescibacterota bacterium]|nr:MAG: PD40 domain-containing protein [Candidatus Latescibacterota bacterium]